jgi:hypothetical protein
MILLSGQHDFTWFPKFLTCGRFPWDAPTLRMVFINRSRRDFDFDFESRQRKTNDRPDLSSERAPQKDKTANFRKQPSDRK